MFDYSSYLNKGLGTPLEVGWHNLDKAVKRYEFAASLLKGSVSVLDVGCGTALLKNYLDPEVHYLGLDVNADMVKVARHRNNMPGIAKLIKSTSEISNLIGGYSSIIFIGVHTIIDKKKMYTTLKKDILICLSKSNHIIINAFHKNTDTKDYKVYYCMNKVIKILNSIGVNYKIHIFEKYEFFIEIK